jgi:hypothetical protein
MKAQQIKNAPKTADGKPAVMACGTRPSTSAPTRHRCVFAFLTETKGGQTKAVQVADIRLEMN